MSLEPIDAETALELYLADKENELSEASLKGHKYRLGHFVRWCDEKEIENLNTLTGRQLHRYRLCCFSNHLQSSMPSKQPRTPEVEISEDSDSGFKPSIHDGEYLIQVRPHENGYQLSLASKTGMGDAAFLRTYGREERFRELLKTKFEAIDSDAVFEVLKEHFGEKEYRIVNLKESVKTFHGRGADLYVETGKMIPTLTDDRDYRDDRWSKDKTYRLRIWPADDVWIKVKDTDSGERVADYWPTSLLEDIRNEEKDDHDRERGPTSVLGVHAPVDSQKLENAPVVHTHIDCSHLEQLENTRFNPEGEKPSKVPAGEFGEIPLRWCSTCRHREPTPDEIRQQYEPSLE